MSEVSQSSVNRDYWDSIAGEFCELTRSRLRGYRGTEELMKTLPLRSSSLNILDLGTGSGLVAISLAKLGHRVTALDSSMKMLDTARLLSREEGVEIETVLADAQDTGLPEGSFDMVIAKDLLFSLEYCVDAIFHWRSLLRPDGYLVIMDGAYCFYAWESEFTRRREYLMAKESRDDLDVMMGGINTDVLREEVEKYYVSRVRHPSWELWTLAGLGFDDIHVLFHDDSDFDTVDDYGRLRYPVNYTVVARLNHGVDDNRSSPEPIANIQSQKGAELKINDALANGIRSEILSRLSSGEKSISELNEGLGLESNHISYHLRVLRDAGLIVRRKSGRIVYYRLCDPDRTGLVLNTLDAMASDNRSNGACHDDRLPCNPE